jgi:hypothetical protein
MDRSEWEIILEELIHMGFIVKKEQVTVIANKMLYFVVTLARYIGFTRFM